LLLNEHLYSMEHLRAFAFQFRRTKSGPMCNKYGQPFIKLKVRNCSQVTGVGAVVASAQVVLRL